MPQVKHEFFSKGIQGGFAKPEIVINMKRVDDAKIAKFDAEAKKDLVAFIDRVSATFAAFREVILSSANT